MNVISVSAKFTLPTEEAIRLKFDNRLDDIVKQNLAQRLAYEIIENGLLNIDPIDYNLLLKYRKDETVFQGSIFICN